MDEAWQLLVRDFRESPAVMLLVLLPAVVGLVPLVLRGRRALVPYGVLLLQGAVWYGYHLMGGVDQVEDSRPMVLLAICLPSAVTLAIALLGAVTGIRGLVEHARAAAPDRRPGVPLG